MQMSEALNRDLLDAVLDDLVYAIHAHLVEHRREDASGAEAQDAQKGQVQVKFRHFRQCIHCDLQEERAGYGKGL